MDFPIFIGGAQRSGTSLARAILGSHPDLAIYQFDLTYWTGLYELTSRVSPPRLRDVLIAYLRQDPKVAAADHQVDFEQLAQRLPRDANRSEIFRSFMELYADERDRPRWGLKSPGSEVRADLILETYPTARYIHLIRDPRNVAASFRNYPGDGLGRYDPYRHMAVWRQSARIAEENSHRFPDRHMTVRYETLVEHTEKVTRTLCEFSRLNYEPEMLEMTGHPGWKGHNSSFSRPNRGHDTEFDETWRPLYSVLLAEEIEQWDYASQPGHARKWDVWRLRMAEWALGLEQILKRWTPMSVLHMAASVRERVRSST